MKIAEDFLQATVTAIVGKHSTQLYHQQGNSLNTVFNVGRYFIYASLKLPYLPKKPCFVYDDLPYFCLGAVAPTVPTDGIGAVAPIAPTDGIDTITANKIYYFSE